MMKTVFALVLVAFISSTKTLAASNNIRGSDTVVLDEIGEEFGRSSSTQLGKMMMMTIERKQRRGLDVGGISSELKRKREKGGEWEQYRSTKLVKKENESMMTTERKLQQQRRGLGVGGISSESKKKREKGGEKEKDTRTKLTK